VVTGIVEAHRCAPGSEDDPGDFKLA
jgi:hypothetical protein